MATTQPFLLVEASIPLSALNTLFDTIEVKKGPSPLKNPTTVEWVSSIPPVSPLSKCGLRCRHSGQKFGC